MKRLLLTAAFLLITQPLFALDPYQWSPMPDDPRAYPQVRERFQQSLAIYDYPTVFRKLQYELETSSLWGKTEPSFQRLLEAFRVLNERFSHFEADLARADKKGETLDDFLARMPTGLFQFPCPDGICFSGKGYELSYAEIETLSDTQAEDILYRIDTVNHFLTDLKKPMQPSMRAIENAKERWEIYMREEMSQFPWEAAFNGWAIGADDIQNPPRRQWILFHPELGVEVSTRSFKDLTAKESLSIELFGKIWYHWKNIDKPEAGLRWWGVAAALSLRDDLRPGIGFVAHYGRFVTLGLVWHDTNRDGRWFNDAPFLMFGIDLFRFAQDRIPANQKKWERALDVRERFFE